MRDVTLGRRRLLSGVGLATAAGLAGCAAPPPKPPPAAPPKSELTARPAAADPGSAIVRSEFVRSEHRKANVQLYLSYPSSVDNPEGLPVVLYLHGKDGPRPTPVPYGTLDALEQASAPFGFVTVDAGFNSYYNDGSANGDVMSMLLEELPRWLRERSLGDSGGLPFAAAGISTGGFGALNYAMHRNRTGAPLSAVGALAPALSRTWDEMRPKNAFQAQAQWQDNDPLHNLDDLGDVPVGIWIGDHDPFLDGARELAAGHRNTPVFAVLPGGHDGSVFDADGAGAIRFLADNLSTQG